MTRIKIVTMAMKAALSAAQRAMPLPAAARSGVVEGIGAAAAEAAARAAGVKPPEGN
jgi:hypothetical protein